MNFRILFILFLCFFQTQMKGQEAERKLAYDNFQKYQKLANQVKDANKERSIEQFRKSFSQTPYRLHELASLKMTAQECLSLLTDDGQFQDMKISEEKIMNEKMLLSRYSVQSGTVAQLVSQAFLRLWKIAEAARKGEITTQDALTDNYLKAIIHYGNIETGRNNDAPRFHASCFLIPTSTVNIYFAFLRKMDDLEAGKDKSPLLKQAADVLKQVSLQAWTQPLRHDETDKNVVQPDRFRNHVWWVGGNALAYRSLLPVAFMYKSIPMIDLLADVCQKCISTTSQNTNSESFWTEGFTTDGAGWGHGRQSLVWGYPIDGTSNALAMLNMLKGSPWEKKLSTENVAALMNFFRGANWYYYKGFTLSGLDRTGMHYDAQPKPIRYVGMINTLLSQWKDSFSPAEIAELKQLQKEGNARNINMGALNDGQYTGTRWFFNNDDLMKKNDQYHIFVNMASVRCDGLESALNVADEYNFFTDDGMTLFQRDGQEYRSIFGAWDVTATPGVTAREGMEKLQPVTNWRGYCSKFNFAGAATHGENAVAGFVFEKMNASDKDNVNDKGTNQGQNPSIYGVKAHKAYVMLGDYFIALGAGITNLQPAIDGTIRTTIDQTAKVNEIQIISQGKQKPVEEGVHSFYTNGTPVWVKQTDKFAYSILPEYSKNAYFICENKKTDWAKMNKENKKTANLSTAVDVLRLWIDHGRTPVNDTYGYVVYTGSKVPDAKLPFSVLSNDSLVQAVQSADEKTTAVVFYSSGSRLKTKSISLAASAPCVVLIESKEAQQEISVQDPMMNASLKQLELKLNGRSIVVDMPQGEWCGKSITIKI